MGNHPCYRVCQNVNKLDTAGDGDGTLSQQWNNREDARAPLLDQQMRLDSYRFPVDRYLVNSGTKIEMVNIIDDEIWNPEPALKPEDEIILRKLHEMLQSTADDLKLLTGELSKFHEPGIQVKTSPTPLDEEFNEKVHIEEVVNAKFHGYKIVDKTSLNKPAMKQEKERLNNAVIKNCNFQKPKVINTGVQANFTPILKKPVVNRNLGITRTRTMHIDEDKSKISSISTKQSNVKAKNDLSSVVYNEFTYKHVEPETKLSTQKILNIQEMPKVSIRSELKQQKVLQIDILPDKQDVDKNTGDKKNVTVIAVEHKSQPMKTDIQAISTNDLRPTKPIFSCNQKPSRKVSKMSTCESSESTNNISSDARHRLKTHKQVLNTMRSSPKSSARIDRSKTKKTAAGKRQLDNKTQLEEWKKKLNVVYDQAASSNKNSNSKSKTSIRRPSKSVHPVNTVENPHKVLNNAEYIPYAQLTLGGVRVSDIEKEISNLPNKNELPLSPILDKIISREHSFHRDSPRENKYKSSPRILTTSDENLLQEVLDIEKSVSKTLSKNDKTKSSDKSSKLVTNIDNSSSASSHESYADDFEEEKTDQSMHSETKVSSKNTIQTGKIISVTKNDDNNVTETSNTKDHYNLDQSETKIRDATLSKSFNLSFKNTVDVYEFIHSVETQESATQSSAAHRISPKETQTSPRNDKPNIKPIHNDLWSPMDPKGEVEKMFKLEKEFIKKLIIDEYGDLLQKNYDKPSTSKESKESDDKERNIAAAQKNTQTSPAHVKSVTTSPPRTKTRTTSPFVLALTVDQQTSPVVIEENVDVDGADDLGISINLSSPRFSLRLPKTSRDVLSNLEVSRRSSEADKKQTNKISNQLRKYTTSSSSSADAENSSSDISSLGEVILKRRLRKKMLSFSETSTSSVNSKYSSKYCSGGILPLRSEGEVSLGQVAQKKNYKSEGEISKMDS